MIIKGIFAIAAAGLLASGAAAQTTSKTMTTTKTSTSVHATNVPVPHHRNVITRYRTCHMVMRHGHKMRVCRRTMMHHNGHHTVVKTKVVTKTN